ncbi:MAG TPA: folylpolyglutamate synthase/dihydrofolate synthase family protein [Nitrospiria bacterium]|nr:folylpolyglutamate synthase/dihydrofolate synthase family protein [Nitrospiria bacterium]
MSYQETVEFLYRLQWHGIRMDLSPARGLLDAVGRPHERYPVLHVGGTNGKGSTAAMLASMLREAGYTVGLYTSPHLVDFTERIRINGAAITPDHVVSLAEELRARMPAGEDPTFFEFTTAMAFLAFARARVDAAVIEVGMGGRLDATNVVRPLVSVITNVDLDHQRYLGDTVTTIASEKAGIIKPGTPVVTASGSPEVLAVLADRATAQGSSITVVGRDVRVEGAGPEAFSYQGRAGRIDGLTCPLLGRHQLTNAATALAAVEHARDRGLAIPIDAIRRGLARVRWEGRLERIKSRPTILVDGAHNAAGAAALADFLAAERAAGRINRLVAVFGILADKDLHTIVERVGALADEVVLTEPSHHRAAPIDTLREAASSLSVPIRLAPTVADALADVEARLSPRDWCVVTGSLYTVGEVKALYQGRGRLSLLRG